MAEGWRIDGGNNKSEKHIPRASSSHLRRSIDLPPNSFCGSVIHACIIVLVDTSQIELTIFTYSEFVTYTQTVNAQYEQ